MIEQFKTLPRYPLFCPDCGHPSFKCLNFWDGLWRCGECGDTRFVTKDGPCYLGLPPNYVEDFPYPEIIDNR